MDVGFDEAQANASFALEKFSSGTGIDVTMSTLSPRDGVARKSTLVLFLACVLRFTRSMCVAPLVGRKDQLRDVFGLLGFRLEDFLLGLDDPEVVALYGVLRQIISKPDRGADACDVAVSECSPNVKEFGTRWLF